jgi:hypothetical protein
MMENIGLQMQDNTVDQLRKEGNKDLGTNEEQEFRRSCRAAYGYK